MVQLFLVKENKLCSNSGTKNKSISTYKIHEVISRIGRGPT